MRTLTMPEIDNILHGAQILGCGGGGEIDWGVRLIRRAADSGKAFRLKCPDSEMGDPMLSIIGAVGGGVSEEIKLRMEPLLEKLSQDEKLERPILHAVKELCEHVGYKPDGFIPTEIGAGNMAVTLFAAAMLDKFVIDGDCCGRAKPKISISTTRIAEINPIPLSVVSPLDEVMILNETGDDRHAEKFCREFAVVSGGICYCARCLAPLSRYKKGMIPGSFSRCLKLGDSVRRAREKG